MNCREVQEQLVAYLDGGVTPSERTLIQAHLAGCDFCQGELAALSVTQSHVSRFLQMRAAQAAPRLRPGVACRRGWRGELRESFGRNAWRRAFGIP